MLKEKITELTTLVSSFPIQAMEIDDQVFSDKPSEQKWSKKEITGHLIDSALNNLQRFIRSQYEFDFVFGYDQNRWVTIQNYQSYQKIDLLDLWSIINRQIITVLNNTPESALTTTSKTAPGEAPVTLKFLIEDYIDHMKHHISQILS